MNSKWLTTIATTALLAGSLGAQAADLSMQPTYKAPTVVPVYNWTGFYVGANGGYGWGTQNPLGLISDRFDHADFSVNGGLFGGTFGAQIQAGHVVIGIEGDLDWANITGRSTIAPTILGAPAGFTMTLASNTNWISTARTRVGWAQDNWLFFGSGGVAILGADAKGASIGGATCGTLGVLPRCSGSDTRPGMALGGGVEWGFSANWSAKVEYLWVSAISGASTEHLNIVRAGINYRFGGL